VVLSFLQDLLGHLLAQQRYFMIFAQVGDAQHPQM
jgi:hypothetical protein